MSLNPDNKQFLTKDGVKILLQDLNQKNTEQSALIYNEINENRAYIDELKNSVQDLELANSQKLTNFGDQTFAGNLTIGTSNKTGDLRVYGDLIVDGKTTTADTETLLVRDNFIFINSDNEDLQTALAGIVIKTGQNTAYGIVYDRSNGSISLGEGVVNNDNNFSFNAGEINPIVTRPQSDKLKDGQLLVWDSATNTIAGTDAYSFQKLEEKFTNWDAHHALVKAVGNLKSDLIEEKQIRTSSDEGLNAAINAVNINLSTNIENVQEKIAKIENAITNVDEMNDSISTLLDKISKNEASPNKLWALSFAPIYSSLNQVIGYKPVFESIDDGILE